MYYNIDYIIPETNINFEIYYHLLFNVKCISLNK